MRWTIVPSVFLLLACGAKTTPQQDFNNFAPPQIGVQLSSPSFTVPAETEWYQCIYMKVPSNVDLDVVEFDSTMLPGSHHMNMFIAPQNNYPDGIADCPGNDMATFQYVYATQQVQATAVLPAHVAIKIPAQAQIVMQSHYVNASASAIQGGVKINLVAVASGSEEIIYAATFAALNLDLSVPPQTSKIETKTCILSSSQPYRVVGFAPHMHSHATEFDVNLYDGTQATDLLYQTFSWHDPPYHYFDPPMILPAGSGFTYSCHYTNTLDYTLVWGNTVTEEMCMLVGYYYPSNGNIVCVN